MIYTVKSLNRHTFNKFSRYNKTIVKIGPALSKTSGLPVTGLTKVEETEYEELLSLPQGTLAQRSPFWENFFVPITEQSMILDTEVNPEHALWVKLLKVDNLIANGASELRTKSDAEFILSSPGEDAKVMNISRKFKKEAYSLFNTLTPSDMRGILLLKGKPSSDTDDEIVENQLGKEMEADFEGFVKIASDKNIKYKIFLTTATNYGVVRREGKNNFAEFFYNEVFLGKGIDAACEFITAKANVVTYQGIKKELAEQLNTKD